MNHARGAMRTNFNAIGKRPRVSKVTVHTRKPTTQVKPKGCETQVETGINSFAGCCLVKTTQSKAAGKNQHPRVFSSFFWCGHFPFRILPAATRVPDPDLAEPSPDPGLAYARPKPGLTSPPCRSEFGPAARTCHDLPPHCLLRAAATALP